MGADKNEKKSVVNQVDALIKEATNPSLLVGTPRYSGGCQTDVLFFFQGAMYSGWASWL